MITFKVTYCIVHFRSKWNETLFWSRLSQIISAHKIHLGTAFKWSCQFLFSRQETLHCCQILFTKASLTQWYIVREEGVLTQPTWNKKSKVGLCQLSMRLRVLLLTGLLSGQQCFYSLGIRFFFFSCAGFRKV